MVRFQEIWQTSFWDVKVLRFLWLTSCNWFATSPKSLIQLKTLSAQQTTTRLESENVWPTKGPFIFYEVGGAGGVWGEVTQKKTALKRGPSKKIREKGGSRKILPLLEGSRGKKFSYLGGLCNFLTTLQKIPPALLRRKKWTVPNGKLFLNGSGTGVWGESTVLRWVSWYHKSDHWSWAVRFWTHGVVIIIIITIIIFWPLLQHSRKHSRDLPRLEVTSQV